LEASIASRFLNEVPQTLVEDLNPRQKPRDINFFSEANEVRETAKRNIYTGKTFNSVENIQQFFAERAQQSLKGPPAAPPASRATPAQRPAPPKGKRGLRAGATVRHPKYGLGTVLRREGEGEDAKLTVSFQGYGLKKLVEKFAGIEEE